MGRNTVTDDKADFPDGEQLQQIRAQISCQTLQRARFVGSCTPIAAVQTGFAGLPNSGRLLQRGNPVTQSDTFSGTVS